MKSEQNGNKKGDYLKKLDAKSKPDFKAKEGKVKKDRKNRQNQDGEGRKRNKNTNRFHRFENVRILQLFLKILIVFIHPSLLSSNLSCFFIELQKISRNVRTPQSCARALKAEQELSSSNNRILKITMPDPVINTEDVQGWSASIESVLFTKTLEARQFTIVLSSGANVKKEIEKLSKVPIGTGTGKLKVKENDPMEVGHLHGHSKDPAELIDPYTL